MLISEKAGHEFEAEKHEATKGKHRRQKEQAASQSSSAQSAGQCVHQELDSTATNEHAQTDHQPSQKILVCEESTIIIIIISHYYVFIIVNVGM